MQQNLENTDKYICENCLLSRVASGCDTVSLLYGVEKCKLFKKAQIIKLLLENLSGEQW